MKMYLLIDFRCNFCSSLSCESWFLIISLVATLLTPAESGWGYVDQSGWSAIHDTSCGGMKQSPINLPDVCVSNSLTRVNPRLDLQLINYDMAIPPSVMTLKNNGHTAVLLLSDSQRPNPWTPKISGSVVGRDKYQLTQLHFHWDKVSILIISSHPTPLL